MIFIYTRYWESPTEKVSKEKCQLTNYSNMLLINVKSNYSGNNQRDEISYYHTLQKILTQPDDLCQVVTNSPCLFVLLHSLRQRVECCAWQKPCKRLDVLRKFRTCRPGEQNSPAVPDCSLQLHQTGPAVSWLGSQVWPQLYQHKTENAVTEPGHVWNVPSLNSAGPPPAVWLPYYNGKLCNTANIQLRLCRVNGHHN